MITNCSITSIYKCFLQTYNCKYMIKLTVVTKQKHNSSQFCLQTQENYILRLRVYNCYCSFNQFQEKNLQAVRLFLLCIFNAYKKKIQILQITSTAYSVQIAQLMIRKHINSAIKDKHYWSMNKILTNIKVSGLDLQHIGLWGEVLLDINSVRGLAKQRGVVVDVQDMDTDQFDGRPLGRALVPDLDGQGEGGRGLSVQGCLYTQQP